MTGKAGLVINVGDIHDQMDVVSKVVLHNTPQNVLCNIISPVFSVGSIEFTIVRIPCMAHMRGVINGGPAIVPFDDIPVHRDKLVLKDRLVSRTKSSGDPGIPSDE